ncbi:MAG TPA: hypothetical protein VH482_30260 [Thermomicrobiales bacterium]|jgi:hypothetical protein
MSSTRATLEQQAEAYERHLRENWDRLPAWEQEQAERYFAWKHANPGSLIYQRPVSSAPRGNEGLSWAVKGGYLCAVAAFLLSPLIFAPIGILLGIYNITRGRYGHGVAHVVLAICGTVLAIVVSALLLDWIQVLQERLVDLQSQRR